MSDSREQIISLFQGKKPLSPPAFSGLIHITAEGLDREGLIFHEIHKDPRKMAKAAASTYKVAGMPSATLPLDLCAPAEALGAVLNFYEGGEHHFPQVAKPLFGSTKYLSEAYFQNADFVTKGRLPIISDAIHVLKGDIGSDVVISGMLPGPYTLLLYLIEPGALFAEMKREPAVVLDALFQLAAFLSRIGNGYHAAGADFITTHEMGGSPGFIGPAKFEQFVLPALKKLHAELPAPRVLSVCGNTNRSMPALAQSGADAISVDQLNNLNASREALQELLLFGNLDPVQTLSVGSESEIRESIRMAKEAGVDAVWPGCDLVSDTPIRNLQVFLTA